MGFFESVVKFSQLMFPLAFFYLKFNVVPEAITGSTSIGERGSNRLLHLKQFWIGLADDLIDLWQE